MSLQTPRIMVEKLQSSLQAKAKSEPSYRFYSLWDKVYREGVLREAYRRSRANAGAPGVDGIDFEAIETAGVEQWLKALQEELRSKSYAPQPLLRVWIPKRNGGQRPLSIPTVKDRVVQTAVVMVLGPIFEADLAPQQYGFRPGLDAKMAVRRVYYHITQHDRREVVDADLSDYFTTIPHGPLLRCVARRVADGQVLSVIKQWLTAPVWERTARGSILRSTEARDRKRGTPQGGSASPLLANLDTPNGDLVIDRKGDLYGTTQFGGGFCDSGSSPGVDAMGCGTVFAISAGTHKETMWYHFNGGSDGMDPRSGLARDSAGNVYGTTYSGGVNCQFGCGTVFEIAAGTHKKTVLYRFKGGRDGAGPEGELFMDSAGNLYGTTFGGGSNCRKRMELGPGCGTVFEIIRN